ncbi:putative oligopeptide transporter, OPT superfamily [Septoria linicola]|nr:putative oligopeptide transporter, OPT superfamily [Septoria linicola]
MNAPTATRSIFTHAFGGASSNEGMGLLNFSLDWQYIQSTFLSLPLKQQLNTWIEYVFWYVCMLSLYHGNVWDSQTFPFMSTSLFTSNGTQLATTSILNDRGTIDPVKLEAVGLPNLTSSTVWGYFTVNAAIGALITHVILFYGKDMKSAWKQARSRTQPDPLYQGMLKFAEVPTWWYLAFFVLTFFAGLIVNLKGETTLPLRHRRLHQPTLPYVILRAVNLANWLKVGQYTKIPPHVMFATQVYGTLLGAAFNYIVMTSIVSNQAAILRDPRGNYIWSGAELQSMTAKLSLGPSRNKCTALKAATSLSCSAS